VRVHARQGGCYCDNVIRQDAKRMRGKAATCYGQRFDRCLLWTPTSPVASSPAPPSSLVPRGGGGGAWLPRELALLGAEQLGALTYSQRGGREKKLCPSDHKGLDKAQICVHTTRIFVYLCVSRLTSNARSPALGTSIYVRIMVQHHAGTLTYYYWLIGLAGN
jgi:hypothetical protein